MQVVIDINENLYTRLFDNGVDNYDDAVDMVKAIRKGTPITPDALADTLMEELMEERIRGKLDSDITYSKEIIPDVKCKLTVSIQDHRPCYCGAELREVWRER